MLLSWLSNADDGLLAIRTPRLNIILSAPQFTYFANRMTLHRLTSIHQLTCWPHLD